MAANCWMPGNGRRRWRQPSRPLQRGGTSRPAGDRLAAGHRRAPDPQEAYAAVSVGARAAIGLAEVRVEPTCRNGTQPSRSTQTTHGDRLLFAGSCAVTVLL